ncbi:hypothetical protein HY745_02865, partial [Candidatus Desantisbacteria bacterium]|nr:hypothetical protein [Candidatus Desantisbacteria bacterium]
MNFQNSSSLADFQDKVFVRYQNSEGILTLKKELKQLESNLWIKTARFTAPSNLVIRHLILIDLIK